MKLWKLLERAIWIITVGMIIAMAIIVWTTFTYPRWAPMVGVLVGLSIWLFGFTMWIRREKDG